MLESQVWTEVQSIFELVLPKAPQLQSPMSAKEVPGWDSLAQIQIIVAIEKKFKIRFHLGEVETTRNVGELVALIQKHLQAK